MILNYTTSIAATKTVAEIQQMLASKGARKIITDYSESGVLVGISFTVTINKMEVLFRLPANWKGVQKAIKNQKRSVAAKYKTDAHAINVCWRIIKDWIEAQMAIVEAEQADIATIFLPYAVMNNNETVSKNFLSEKGRDLLLIGG